MSNTFTRGLRRLFGMKDKPRKRVAPYGSIARPVLISDRIEEIEIKSSKPVKKKSSKKKTSRKKATKKKVARKKSTKK